MIWVWVALAAWVTMAAIGIFATVGSTRASRQPPGSWRWYPGEGGPPRG